MRGEKRALPKGWLGSATDLVAVFTANHMNVNNNKKCKGITQTIP